MEIHVHERGGVLGIDRRVDVKDGTLTVVVNGVPRARRRLEPAVQARLRELVARLPSRLQVNRYTGPRISDSMETTVYISDRGRDQQLEIKSGDDAPELWEFLGAVTEISPE